MIDHIRVSPLAFFAAFLDITTEQAQALNEAWPSCKNLTTLMLCKIFPRVAERLGLHCYNRDYYTLDGIFYVDTDKENFANGTTYANFIAVALEHENDAWTTAVEMNKLQLFNAPLKVLITYPESVAHGAMLLGKYSKIIEDADIFKDITSLRRQLVIFGFRTDSPSWEAFEYQEGSFRAVAQQAGAFASGDECAYIAHVPRRRLPGTSPGTAKGPLP